MQSKIQIDATAMGSRAQRGIVNGLRSKIHRWQVSLHRAYLRSTLRLVALEIRNFPLRIEAIRKHPSIRYGSTILAASWDRGIGNVYLENRYSRSCMSRIQELQKDHHWLGPLDEEIAARMYRWGALWALDNLASCTETHSKEPTHTSQSS